MAKHVCDVPECGEEIPEGRGSKGGLPICDRCRSGQYYWRKQGLAAVHTRRERLHFFEQRLDYLSPHIQRMIGDARNRVRKARKAASENGVRH
jgi:hypothetical protein